MEAPNHKDTEIDESALDIECLEQATKFRQHSSYLAHCKKILLKAKKRVDILKTDMERVKAELDGKMRANPEEYGLGKITETALGNAILLHEDFKTAQKEYFDAQDEVIEAQFEFDNSLGDVQAMDQKKSNLQDLIRLHGQNYFAGPKVPRDISFERQAKENQRKEADAGVAEKLQRRRNRRDK